MTDSKRDAHRMYDEFGGLLLERGLATGKGRPLTAEEAVEDPVCSVYLEVLIDLILGMKRELS